MCVKCAEMLSMTVRQGIRRAGMTGGIPFFFSTAERAMKHGRSSGYIRNYSQKDACRTCKTKQNTNKTNTKHKQKNKPTQQETAHAAGRVKKVKR